MPTGELCAGAGTHSD